APTQTAKRYAKVRKFMDSLLLNNISGNSPRTPYTPERPYIPGEGGFVSVGANRLNNRFGARGYDYPRLGAEYVDIPPLAAPEPPQHEAAQGDDVERRPHPGAHGAQFQDVGHE